jgi:hypothetical protein
LVIEFSLLQHRDIQLTCHRIKAVAQRFGHRHAMGTAVEKLGGLCSPGSQMRATPGSFCELRMSRII